MTDERADEPVPRRFRRWTVDLQAVVRIENILRACTVFDITPGGAWLEAEDAAQARVGATAELDLEDFPVIPAAIRHKAGNRLGLLFLHDGEAEEELGRHLVALRPVRAEPRKAVGIEATLTLNRLDQRIACTVLDVARLGASLTIADARRLSAGDMVTLTIPAYGEVMATVGRMSEAHVGLVFREALTGDLPG